MLIISGLPSNADDWQAGLHQSPYRMRAPTSWSCVNETMVSTCCGHNAQHSPALLRSVEVISWSPALCSPSIIKLTWASEIMGGDEQDFYYPSLLCGWGFVMTTVDPGTHGPSRLTHWCVGPEQWWWCEVTSRGGWEMSWEGWEYVTGMWENVTNIRSPVPGDQVKHERLEFVTILKYELLWQKESSRRELVYPEHGQHAPVSSCVLALQSVQCLCTVSLDVTMSPCNILLILITGAQLQARSHLHSTTLVQYCLWSPAWPQLVPHCHQSTMTSSYHCHCVSSDLSYMDVISAPSWGWGQLGTG